MLVYVPVDDPLSLMQLLNESEERSQSPIWKCEKDGIALIGALAPPAGVFPGAIESSLDRRAALN
jgi:hypothetical protein